MNSIFDPIDALKAQLQSLLPMKPEDQQRLDKKIRLEFNYNSNHIEGNTLTYGETELLLIFDKTTGNHDMREYEEMKAHDVAYNIINEWAADKERPLTETAIKNLHALLLVRPFWKDAITPDGQATRRQIKVGDYKEHPNSVRLQNGELFHYASVADTPIKMGELIQWFRDEEEKKELHPVALAALLHYKFVLIHPFDDGNGRLSRLLMNYVLLKYNWPPVVIKTAKKKEYLFALNQADSGEISKFIEYIISQTEWGLDLYIKAANGESLEEKGDLEKEIEVFKKQQLSTGSITKHPTGVYKIFTHFSDIVWREIKGALVQFDNFFGESKEFHLVNRREEKYEKKTLLSLGFIGGDEPDKSLIFGYDVHTKNIDQVDWKLTFYGLINARQNVNVDVNARILFKTEQYSIQILIDEAVAWQASYPYKSMILTGDIEKLKTALVRGVFEEIKQRLSENS